MCNVKLIDCMVVCVCKLCTNFICDDCPFMEGRKINNWGERKKRKRERKRNYGNSINA